MQPSKGEYDRMTKKASPPSPYIRNGLQAFVCGGGICTLGQALFAWYTSVGMPENGARATVSVTLVGLVALFTGLGVYDDFAGFAGAGSLVPITGFANAMVSPAIEYKQEGFVMGVGANLFKIAGPVIAYGTAASVVYGLIYWIMGMF
ncbi:MAG: stage V sporulation protein AC [Clostridia bacterium]|nr:stage V sporulation protein AC [Clostridia bacterium]